MIELYIPYLAMGIFLWYILELPKTAILPMFLCWPLACLVILAVWAEYGLEWASARIEKMLEKDDYEGW